MNTVKHSRGLSSRSLQKKPLHHKGSNNGKAYLCTLLLASLIGTYLDLWMVGKGYYSFPFRPFPTIFSINIVFTLLVLPISTFFLIYFFKRINRLLRLVISILLSVVMAILEHFFEQLGFFVHSNDWSHFYSLFGYFVFIILMWKFYKWLNSN
ncbi:CBO0543 family protein [Anaerobacillus sp. MEB173]|uniref:CBO0543 family protein n=1 Tax=Anaerobacillus sp. MEB173 TaxID=3383345 RepID=UPI003F936300